MSAPERGATSADGQTEEATERSTVQDVPRSLNDEGKPPRPWKPRVKGSSVGSNSATRASQAPAFVRTEQAANLRGSMGFRPETLWKYLFSELSWGTAETASGVPSVYPIHNVVKVPLYLERFLLMGVAACANLLLHNFTFLPLRFLHACWALLATCFGRRGGRKRLVTDALLYDLMRGITILLAVGLLSLIQISYVYHYIRGEAFIKLYVIFNILDILNKLLCALGQDVLEGLYEATVIALGPTQAKQSNSQEKGILPPFLSLAIHIVAAVAYVWLHSALLFTQIVCFNVAMNSRSAALLTLLISNNFIELKAAVFKRFGAENLFQVACSDAVERFQLLVFFALVLLQEYSPGKNMENLVNMAGFIMGAEFFVDNVKHCFIAKFNRLDRYIYTHFRGILAHDIVSTRLHMKETLDPTHSQGRRLGLPVIPITCVWIRLVHEKLLGMEFQFLSVQGVVWGLALFLFLLLLKVLVSMGLLHLAFRRVMSEPQLAQRLGLVVPSSPSPDKSEPSASYTSKIFRAVLTPHCTPQRPVTHAPPVPIALPPAAQDTRAEKTGPGQSKPHISASDGDSDAASSYDTLTSTDGASAPSSPGSGVRRRLRVDSLSMEPGMDSAVPARTQEVEPTPATVPGSAASCIGGPRALPAVAPEKERGVDPDQMLKIINSVGRYTLSAARVPL